MLPAGTKCPASAAASRNCRSARSKPCMGKSSQVTEHQAGKHTRNCSLFSRLLEVDAHHEPAWGGRADLPETSLLKHGHRADVQLLVDHVGSHARVAAQGARPLTASVLDRREEKGGCDAAPAEALPDVKAGDSPDCGIVRVLVTALPGHGEDPLQAVEVTSRADRAPPGWLILQPSDQPARRRVRVPKARLLTQPVLALLSRLLAERLPRPQAVTLALTARGGATIAEHRLNVIKRHLVRGHDPQRRLTRVLGVRQRKTRFPRHPA